jgi:hypothetical protein
VPIAQHLVTELHVVLVRRPEYLPGVQFGNNRQRPAPGVHRWFEAQ